MKRSLVLAILGVMVSTSSFAARDNTVNQALGSVSLYVTFAASPSVATTMCIANEFDYGTDRYLVACMPTHTVLASLDKVLPKELIKAAQEDAAQFVAFEGEIEKSAILDTVFEAMDSVKEIQGLSDADKARVVLVLNDEMKN